jgi:hypothetical protein
MNVTLVARLPLSPVEQKLCRCEQVLFILEHYFASESFAALRETFSSAYPDKGITG